MDMIWYRIARDRSSVIITPPQLNNTLTQQNHGNLSRALHVTLHTLSIISYSNQFFLRPLIHTAPIQVRQSLCSLSVPVAKHKRTNGWIRPQR